MRKTKEFLVNGSTEQVALARLFEAIFAYLKTHQDDWEWLKEPEITHRKDRWHAYARIEFT